MTEHEDSVLQKVQIPNNLEACQAALSKAQQETETLRDKYLRATAEVENVRKWTERDTLARAKETQRNLLRQLLDVIDNLERALAQPVEQAARHAATSIAGTTTQGLQLILRQLEQVLARAGVERIPAQPGQPFDPGVHEAVAATPIVGSTTEARRKVTEPVIGEVVQPGYVHEGTLLRPARVVVVQPANKPTAED